MVAAVRERDAQRVIQFLRRRVKNLSQEALARMCGVAQSTITRAEAGKGLTDRRRAYEALQGLGALTVSGPTASGPSASTMPLGAEPASLLTFLPDPRAVTVRSRNTRSSVDGLLAAVVALDDQAGGGNLYTPLNEYASRMRDLVDHGGHGMEAFGPLSQMVGWIAMDAGLQGAARSHLTTAVYAGHETGDTDLAASALSYRSLQDTYLGRSRPALALAKTAVETGADASPAVCSILHARLARAQAKLRDADGTRSSIERMNLAFARARHEGDFPVWLSYVDEIEISAQAGAAYLDLGLFDEALDALWHAIELLRERVPHRMRDQSHYLVRVARAHLAQGDLVAACGVAEEALHLGELVRSPRVDDRVREFRTELGSWSRHDAAQAFLHRSQALVTASSAPNQR